MKSILKSVNVGVGSQDPLVYFLQSCFAGHGAAAVAGATFSDVQFVVGCEERAPFHLHRAVLCARSPYLASMFGSRWRGRATVHLANAKLSAESFGSVMRFLYTGRLEMPAWLTGDTVRLCKQLKLDALRAEIEQWATKHGVAVGDGVGASAADFEAAAERCKEEESALNKRVRGKRAQEAV